MNHMSNAEQTEFEPGTLEHLNPHTVEVDGNVRDDPALTKQFIASIKENGVLVPITAVRAQDGTVRVRTGQRRTLAAREAGLQRIPVYVIGAGWEDTTQRTIEQLVENDHRTTLTPVQRVHGIQQLLDDGLSLTKVAKKLAVSRERVQASQAVAGSQTATEALQNGQLSLTEAAAITEFEGDERALQRLLSAGSSYNFEHTLSMLREQRGTAQRLAAAEQEWRDKGYTVLERMPASWDPDFVGWDFLLKDGQPLTEDFVTDPKHWAVTLWEDTVITRKDTGAEVYDDEVDWGTRDNPDAQPEEGKLHVDAVVEAEAIVPEFYYCIDLAGAGLTANERFVRFSGQAAQQLDAEGGNSDSGNVDRVDEIGPVLVDEKAEAEKRERRQVLALNKLGDAALNVRRQFVRNLLARKTPPKGAAIFVAGRLSGDPHLLSDYRADEITAELLGAEHVEGTGYQYQVGKVVRGIAKLVAALPDNGDNRAQVITLGLVLGALEARTPKDAWRKSKWDQDATLKPYLEFLVANGYELAPVEQVMIGKRKADKVYDAYLAEQ